VTDIKMKKEFIILLRYLSLSARALIKRYLKLAKILETVVSLTSVVSVTCHSVGINLRATAKSASGKMGFGNLV